MRIANTQFLHKPKDFLKQVESKSVDAVIIDQVEQIIENFVIPKGLVLDCFMGSGTTALICKKLNRDFIGCDNNQEYVDLANNRLSVILRLGGEKLALRF